MLDFGYFIRTAALFQRFKSNEKLINLLSESVVYGRCWPNDLDFNWHMNNARYLRESDFARISLLLETGLWNSIVKRRKNGMKDAHALVSALQIQYRQSIELGDRFKFISRINAWDDKAFYLEQWMIREKTNEKVFSLLVRLAVTPRSLTPQMLVDDIQNKSIESPPFSPSMQSFKDNYKINFQEIPSKL
ncbi:unnamed protein product [Adineta steineri]|uniref:Protein THEM6 n=2 Tax=Adineta steineri TaxID=433720 RepID=A0A813Y3V9_9BILA|nr:unnamed protein product [Adineta steineri]